MKYGEEERKEFAEFQRRRSTLVEAFMKEVVPNFNPTPGAKRAIYMDTVVLPKKQKVDNKGDNDQRIPAPGPVPSPKPVEQPQPQSKPTTSATSNPKEKKTYKSKSVVSSVSSSSSSSSSSTSNSDSSSSTKKSENPIKDVLSINAPEEESYEVQESNEIPTYSPTNQMEADD
ncbi:uncharacterized protein LOC134236025 [Saccostrea cucullata]|uniref:uncharacterized protein LOC134236025 n=1 Tax=Saccostrea cuccullata TaxID=36930 RepID=UPI002ED01E3C